MRKKSIILLILVTSFLSGYVIKDIETDYFIKINNSISASSSSDYPEQNDNLYSIEEEEISYDNYEKDNGLQNTEQINNLFEKTEKNTDNKEQLKSNLEVNFIDVGQADACLLEANGHYMLIDAGNNDDTDLILNYLHSKNIVTIDYLIGTHPHEDHIGSMDTVINNFQVDNIYLPKIVHTSKTFEDVLTAIENKNLKINEPVSGSEFYFNDMPVKILAPLKEYSDLNNNSITLKITDGNIDFLFTGDIEAEAEYDIIQSEADLSADVLKVAHHGSDSSSTEEFIKKVSPKYAVISAGKNNNYGQPANYVLDLLSKLNIITYRTDQSGTITFRTDGENIEIIENSYDFFIQNDTLVDKQEYNNSNLFDLEENSKKNQPENYNSENYYIGNKNSKKFHLPSCNTLPSEKNQVILSSLEEAASENYSPCKICNPS